MKKQKSKNELCAARHIRKAYEILGDVTPISADCGKLCDRACCTSGKRGKSEELGMLLFPGEEGFFSPSLKKQKIVIGGKPGYFASCSGRCIRRFRPLSCRIFPLLPYVAKDDRDLSKPFRFSIIQDPRGKYLCPLIYAGDHVEEKFRERVAMAITEAGKCRSVRSFIFTLSEIADEYRRFTFD
ncbi:MAG: hypothetical protein II350_00845 [Clostridia bacterium]|nr:hypothetical protein [Clostridia bacterium]